uniref:BHLH domain-containing protein n=1 Tax=Leersia perrieri TaxID=77586 RepID=A0A0D9WD25_9ORYZ
MTVTKAAVAPRISPARRKRMAKNAESKERMEALRSLVPGSGEAAAEIDGGRQLDAEELLFRAADYIARLQVQVKVMQFMVDVLEHTKDFF